MKLVLLISLSVLFSYGPLNLFAPIPLAFGHLLYGRNKSTAIAFVTILLLGLFTFIPSNFYLMMAFCCAYIFAIFIAESILNNWHPVRALIFSGISLISTLWVLLFLFFLFSATAPKAMVFNSVNDFIEIFKKDNAQLMLSDAPGATAIKELLRDPNLISQMILNWFFSLIFISIFATFWIGFLVILKNRHIWSKHVISYAYTHKDLLTFKSHEYLIYFLIGGLVFYVGGDFLEIDIPTLEVFGGNILFCLSFFYFIQGLGIYLDFLHFLKIYKVMRLFFTVLTVLVAWKILVILGVFDLWVNFRKFFRTSRKIN